MKKHYDFSTDIVVVFENNEELQLSNVTDVWTDDSQQFLHFIDWFGNEVATVNVSKVRYWRPN